MTAGEGGHRHSYPGEELDLGRDGESLPWLESVDDEDGREQGFDTTRLIGIGLLMVAALGLIVGGIWWFTNRATGGGPEPDGSLISAPAEPYRVRPENEGGKTFAGTGDTSFAVGEGQTREGRLASVPAPASAAPEPEADSTDGAPSEPAPPRSAALPAGTAVQVGAYSSRADAEIGWSTLIRQTEVLSGVEYRIVEGRADIGTVFRLQAAAGDAGNARRMCQALKGDGLPCTVK